MCRGMKMVDVAVNNMDKIVGVVGPVTETGEGC